MDTVQSLVVSSPFDTGAYTERLENGWSDQAPQGIYSTTFTYITQKYGG